TKGPQPRGQLDPDPLAELVRGIAVEAEPGTPAVEQGIITPEERDPGGMVTPVAHPTQERRAGLVAGILGSDRRHPGCKPGGGNQRVHPHSLVTRVFVIIMKHDDVLVWRLRCNHDNLQRPIRAMGRCAVATSSQSKDVSGRLDLRAKWLETL